MTKRRVPEQFWMTDKSPAVTPVLEWMFLSSETLAFEAYCRVIGLRGLISMKKYLDLTIEVCSNAFRATFWKKVIGRNMDWFDLSLMTLCKGTISWGQKGFEFDVFFRSSKCSRIPSQCDDT